MGSPRTTDPSRRRFVRAALLCSAGVLALAGYAYFLAPKGGRSVSGGPPSSQGSVSLPGASEITVKVVYFGMPTAETGTKSETINLQSPAHLSDLQDALAELHPGLRKMFPAMLFLVNGVSATGNPEIKDDSEVDILALAAGG